MLEAEMQYHNALEWRRMSFVAARQTVVVQGPGLILMGWGINEEKTEGMRWAKVLGVHHFHL